MQLLWKETRLLLGLTINFPFLCFLSDKRGLQDNYVATFIKRENLILYRDLQGVNEGKCQVDDELGNDHRHLYVFQLFFILNKGLSVS